MSRPDPDFTCEGRAAVSGRANRLVPLFFQERASFGEILEVGSHEVPQPLRRLLDHRSHMTVAMEAHVGGSLGLRVMQEHRESAPSGPGPRGRYAREIMLLSSGGKPVQYGLVRVDLSAVGAAVSERILAGSAPLGRVLIEAGTLRDVHDVTLVRIATGRELARRIGVDPGRTLFGRFAMISLAAGSPEQQLPAPTAGGTRFPTSMSPSQASHPAVELLEIPLVESTRST